MIWQWRSVSSMSEADYAVWFAAMEPEKQRRIDGLRQADDRRRSVCADHLVRELLAEVGGIPMTAVKLATAEHGRPIALCPEKYISISHSGDRVLCAVSDHPVGVDIQRMRPVRRALIDRICLPEERAYVGEDPRRFFELWCFKEAVFKCRGTGITAFAEVNRSAEPSPYLCRAEGEYMLCIVGE